jgi:hypothetical protein
VYIEKKIPWMARWGVQKPHWGTLFLSTQLKKEKIYFSFYFWLEQERKTIFCDIYLFFLFILLPSKKQILKFLSFLNWCVSGSCVFLIEIFIIFSILEFLRTQIRKQLNQHNFKLQIKPPRKFDPSLVERIKILLVNTIENS